MRKLIITALAAGGLVLTAAACTTTPISKATSNAEHNAEMRDQQALQSAQPVPHYNWSQIRQTKIDAETIEANGSATTSFFFQMGLPDPVFVCPSIGLPVAVNTELTNPSQPYQGNIDFGQSDVAVGQMDPNGIYSSPSSTGTDVICVLNSGQKYLQYWEGDVMAVTGVAHWDTGTRQVVVTGAPTYQLKTGG